MADIIKALASLLNCSTGDVRKALYFDSALVIDSGFVPARVGQLLSPRELADLREKYRMTSALPPAMRAL